MSGAYAPVTLFPEVLLLTSYFEAGVPALIANSRREMLRTHIHATQTVEEGILQQRYEMEAG